MRPDPAQNLTLQSTNTSLRATFRIPHELHHLPPGVKHRLLYKSQFDNGGGEWILADNGPSYNVSLEDRVVDIHGLVPYGLYKVKVELISGKNNFTTVRDWYVSEPAVATGRTKSALPASPPMTTPGGFQVKLVYYISMIKTAF